MTSVIRTVQSVRTPAPRAPRRSKRWAWLASGVVVVTMLALHLGTSHASADENAIHSGFSKACLDVFHNGTADGTPIDAAPCNGTGAQAWTTAAMTIRHAGSRKCIGADSDGTVTLQACSNTPGQVWLRDRQGYFNPDSGKCLSAATAGARVQLADCGGLASASGKWLPASAAQESDCGGSEGTAVACNAVKQWAAWQASGSNHEALLTTYTDGTPYEEWCADFVSYVYQQAGRPFTDGAADGWDENDASTIQYMGFTRHPAGSSYVPQAGDVAFFNYPGGHVEIVVSGGKKPTFVYGNSAQIDPATGNGQMKANTITQDGDDGSVVYYLSPRT